MSLALGTRLGPYEIEAAIGAGGMGEVYRAKDTRLDRVVAIKVLPAHLAAQPELRQRLEREARAVSSLNHPHICALYDIGHQDGLDFLVMEYLEGETLAERLAKGPLPTEQVVRYGEEIADALDKAHRQGMVHRDLKPGNIMLTKAGAKLLDFGLAKATAVVGPAIPGLSTSPTRSTPITAEGTVVGTFQYMAPEQLEGKEADARSDIFAFGAVLYEMATGRKAFQGKSQASLIASILSSEPPPISTLQPMTPPAFDQLVKTCLAKDPDERWQTAHDVMLQLEWIAEGGSQAGVPAPVVARRRSRERIAWAVVAVLGLLAVTFAAALFLRPAPDARAIRSFLLPPEKASFSFVGTGGGPPAVSPDGRRLAFVASTSDGKSLLWVRPLDALSAQPLTGTEGASYPFWSPDSRFLGFFADGKLKKVEASGGPPLTLCDAPQGRGGTWNRDGVIVFTPDVSSPLFRVSAAGGEATPITQLDQSHHETTHRWPYFLPDGRHFVYLARGPASASESEANAIYVASLDSKERKLVLHASSNAAYAPGYLLFVRETTLMVQPFDAKRLQLTGDAFPIAEQIQFDPPISRGVFSVSENGILAYQTGSAQTGSQLLWFDRSGKQIGALGDASALQFSPRISPDRQRVAVELFEPHSRNLDVWVYDVARGMRTRFTFDPAFDRRPVWSPDGSRIIFASNRKGHQDLYQKASSGAANEELLFESNLDKSPTSWSSDGRFLVYHSTGDPNTKLDLWVLPLVGDRKPIPFLRTPFEEWDGQFSPDGRWIAYASNESGRDEIYAAPFPGPGGKFQLSTSGGTLPRWRRDGKELFYLSLDNKLMAAEVKEKGSTLEVGAVRALFETRPQRPGFVYDVSPDGQRFLIATTFSEKNSLPVALVVNWTAGLRH